MDYQRFIKQIPNLYENWRQKSIQPKSKKFGEILDQNQETTTANVLQILNFAVECMDVSEIYCQVGACSTDTLIGALIDHPEQMAYIIDEFAEYDPNGYKLERFKERLEQYDLSCQVCVCDQSFEEFFAELKEIGTEDKIGVYFYNSKSDYRSNLLALLHSKAFLSDQALIIIHGSYWATTQQAIYDFVATNPECHILLNLTTSIPNCQTFWDGIYILSWDVMQKDYCPTEIINQAYQPVVIQSIHELQLVEKIDVWNALGNALFQDNQFSSAESAYRKAISINPNHYGSYLNLGNLLIERNQIQQAISNYQTALQLSPNNADILDNLETALNLQKNPDQLVNSLVDRELILIMNLTANGKPQEAIYKAEMAAQMFPSYEYIFNAFNNLTLPHVYENEDEIRFYRHRFQQGLQQLSQQLSLATPEAKRIACKIILRTNFYLAYQGLNDKDLQCQYGNLVHQIIAANYPHLVQKLTMPPLDDTSKIRVGYVSAYHNHPGVSPFIGYFRYGNRQNISIYSYLSGDIDNASQIVRDNSDVFHHIPNNWESLCEQILSDKLHILVYPEIGMEKTIFQMAALRLAPIQCMAWGHPVTSGLPTIDYYLSSELIEPENAQDHYTEKLIRLANIGVAYPNPNLNITNTKTREDYQLQNRDVIYLCTQAQMKYLPQYDYIFPEIALRVPNAKFVFLRGNPLKKRLSEAFAKLGLNSEDYCIYKNGLPKQEYLMLNQLSDVFLDTFNFSGGHTSLDAIACHLPVVTCSGEFMRGRQSYAFLKMLGVVDTIAATQAEYIEIAVKLGLDSEWRQDIAERMSNRLGNLFDDQNCITSLEDFYTRIVTEALN